jgi:trypsin
MVRVFTFAQLFLFAALSTKVAAQDHDAKIVGGEDAVEGDFPYIVSLQYENAGRHFCGGSLLDSTTVMTAAHCIVGKVSRHIKVKADILVGHIQNIDNACTCIFLTNQIKKKNLGSDGKTSLGKSQISHPQYESGCRLVQRDVELAEERDHDIGILKLETPIEISSYAPLPDASNDPSPGSKATVAGW